MLVQQSMTILALQQTLFLDTSVEKLVILQQYRFHSYPLPHFFFECLERCDEVSTAFDELAISQGSRGLQDLQPRILVCLSAALATMCVITNQTGRSRRMAGCS